MTDQQKPEKKKRGRPAKEHRPTFSFRLSNDLRAKLQTSADRTGLSLSEEIERRLHESFTSATMIEMMGGQDISRLLMTFSYAAQIVENETGKKFWADLTTNIALKIALKNVIDLIKTPAANVEGGQFSPLRELGVPYAVGHDAATRAVNMALGKVKSRPENKVKI